MSLKAVCSGDQFIASRAQKEAIISEFGGMCCEMEGAAIAQVCCLNGTPFVIIRAISDKADNSEEMSYMEFEPVFPFVAWFFPNQFLFGFT